MSLGEYRAGWEGVRKAREERVGGDWTPPPHSLIIVVHHEQFLVDRHKVYWHLSWFSDQCLRNDERKFSVILLQNLFTVQTWQILPPYRHL